MLIIDAHNHAEWYGYNLERYLENMDAYGIERTWLLSWEAPEDEYDPTYNHVMPLLGRNGPIPFERGLYFVDQVPERFVLGYAPDPRRPDAQDRLAAAMSIHGVQVYGELKLRMMYDNPDALRIFRYCGAQGLPVTIHIDYPIDNDRKYPRPNYWYGGGIDALERALAACPETNFVGHAPGFWAHISGDEQYRQVYYPEGQVTPGGRIVELLRKHPNLYCDTSAGSGHTALSRDRDHAREFLLEFQDRVLYGRDSFDNRHQELLNSLDLPEEVLRKIYSGNARRLIGEAE
jgi:hypothetical protein